MSDRFILITGCSGGGKSTLLAALAAHGYATIPEPGRRIVRAEQAGDGHALPWINMQAFAERAVELSRTDLRCAKKQEGVVFFDRGLVDAALALAIAGGPPYRETLGRDRCYAQRVFLAPPWPEIYTTDPERQHDLAQAEAEYQRLADTLPKLGYQPLLLPKTPVADRVGFVLAALGLS